MNVHQQVAACAALLLTASSCGRTGVLPMGTPLRPNCGACGRSCSASACEGGRCEPQLVATSTATVNGELALANGSVFWSAFGAGDAGSIMRAPAAGGPSRSVAAGQDHPLDLVAIDGDVFWINNGSPCCGTDGKGAVMKSGQEGGPAVVLAEASSPLGIAVDSTYAYWSSGHSIERVLKSGAGGKTTFASGASWKPESVSTRGGAVYWSDAIGELWRASALDMAATRLVATQGRPGAIAVTDDALYWVDRTSPGAIRRMPLEGGPQATLASNTSAAFGLAVDSECAYWVGTDNTSRDDAGRALIDEAILACPLSGCGAANSRMIVFANDQRSPFDVAVDAAHVYWTAANGVFRVAR